MLIGIIPTDCLFDFPSEICLDKHSYDLRKENKRERLIKERLKRENLRNRELKQKLNKRIEALEIAKLGLNTQICKFEQLLEEDADFRADKATLANIRMCYTSKREIIEHLKMIQIDIGKLEEDEKLIQVIILDL